jgi:UDP-2,4-diacetamido-2,4,6-trideoxy-beta-L-altropyranose hydrolase
MPRLYLRADASPEMGTGHFMRCLALADAWAAAGGEAIFICAELPAPLGDLAVAGKHQIRKLAAAHPSPSDAALTAAVVTQAPGWLVLDGYHFDSGYQWGLKGAGVRLAVIDDFCHCEGYHCEVLINYSLDADRFRYPSDIKLLVGPQYALLRSQFNAWGDWQRQIPREARNILVTFGGGRTAALAQDVAWALPQWLQKPSEVHLLTGKVDTAVSLPAGTNIAFHVDERIEDIAARMVWADLAITAGGTTCYELAAMGVPAVIVAVAENQRNNAAAFTAAGAAVCVGEALEGLPQGLGRVVAELAANQDIRRAMSRAGRALVDGKGSERVAQVLLHT